MDGVSEEKKHSQWDVANIAATYFALVNLIVLGDDLGQVNARACWTWVRRLQLVDGSFGEGIEPEGKIHGGRDVRFCYCAMGIRWALLRSQGAVVREADIDIRAMESFIAASQVCEIDDDHHAIHPFVHLWNYEKGAKAGLTRRLRLMKVASLNDPYMKLTVRMPSPLRRDPFRARFMLIRCDPWQLVGPTAVPERSAF